MPKYHVECQHCGERSEVEMSFAQFDEAKAQGGVVGWHACGGPYHVRIFDAPVFHLKGYGFYKTDNASDLERYQRDHFDGSGDRSEKKAMERRIKDPRSSIPDWKPKGR